jgi:hypothetical protein
MPKHASRDALRFAALAPDEHRQVGVAEAYGRNAALSERDAFEAARRAAAAKRSGCGGRTVVLGVAVLAVLLAVPGALFVANNQRSGGGKEGSPILALPSPADVAPASAPAAAFAAVSTAVVSAFTAAAAPAATDAPLVVRSTGPLAVVGDALRSGMSFVVPSAAAAVEADDGGRALVPGHGHGAADGENGGAGGSGGGALKAAVGLVLALAAVAGAAVVNARAKRGAAAAEAGLSKPEATGTGAGSGSGSRRGSMPGDPQPLPGQRPEDAQGGAAADGAAAVASTPSTFGAPSPASAAAAALAGEGFAAHPADAKSPAPHAGGKTHRRVPTTVSDDGRAREPPECRSGACSTSRPMAVCH